MSGPSAQQESLSGNRPDRRVSLGHWTTAAAAVFVAVLAIRPVTSYDIGYHLAYGRELLDHGRIVDTNRFIYTRLDPKRLSDPSQLGPGCRFDERSGEYRFVNLNWLSQGLFAAVERVGGWNGLCLLRAVLVAGVFFIVAWLMRRGGVARPWIAAGLVLAALASYERFDLRPELLGVLVLLGQWALLSGQRVKADSRVGGILPARAAAVPAVKLSRMGEKREGKMPSVRAGGTPATLLDPFGWRRAAGVIALQVLAVNVHSYFLLGVGLSGIVLADALLRWLWAKSVAQTEPGELTERMKWLTVATIGATLACLVNPWFARGAILPLQTLAYLSRHGIMDRPLSPDVHPWALIGELVPTFSKTLWSLRATWVFVAVLAVGSLGALAALARRRWALAGVLAGMAAVSVAARRNMMLGAVFIVPISLAALAGLWAHFRPRLEDMPAQRRILSWVNRLVAAGVIVLAAWLSVTVATGDFYFADRRVWRLGLGVSRVMVPVDAAEWINDRQPAGRLWCDFADSSNLLFLTDGRYEVPVLTNTFAMPPYVMRENLDMTGWRTEPGVVELPPEFRKFVRDYDVGTAVVRFTQQVPPIIRELKRDANWAPVQLGVRHAVFVRRDGPAGKLAASDGLTEESFDIDRYVAYVVAADPSVPEQALYDAGRLLAAMDWPVHAVRLWREALARRPDYPEAAARLFDLYIQQAKQFWARGQQTLEKIVETLSQQGHWAEAQTARRGAMDDLHMAELLLVRASALRPDDKKLRESLGALRHWLETMAPTTQPATQAAGPPTQATQPAGVPPSRIER